MAITTLKNDDTAVMKNFKNGMRHLYDIYVSDETSEMQYLENTRPKINRAGQAFIEKYQQEDKEINSLTVFSYINSIKNEKELNGFLSIAHYNAKYYNKLSQAVDKNQMIFAVNNLYIAGVFAKYIHFLILQKKPVTKEDKKLAQVTFRKFEKQPTFQLGMLFVEKLLAKRKVKNKAGRKSDKEIVLEFKFRKTKKVSIKKVSTKSKKKLSRKK